MQKYQLFFLPITQIFIVFSCQIPSLSCPRFAIGRSITVTVVRVLLFDTCHDTAFLRSMFSRMRQNRLATCHFRMP